MQTLAIFCIQILTFTIADPVLSTSDATVCLPLPKFLGTVKYPSVVPDSPTFDLPNIAARV